MRVNKSNIEPRGTVGRLRLEHPSLEYRMESLRLARAIIADLEPGGTVSRPKAEPRPLAYCVEDVAKALGIGRTHVFQLIKEGKLRPMKIGRRTLVTVLELEDFISRQGV